MYNRLELIGSLARANHIVNGLHIFVEYRKDREGPIYGYILGDGETAERLEALMQGTDGFYRLEARPIGKLNPFVSSNTVLLRNISMRGRRDDSELNRIQYQIAQLEFQDIKEEKQLASAPGEQIVSFSIRGAREFWPAFYSRTLRYDGNVETKQKLVTISIDGFRNVRVGFHFIYDQAEVAGTNGTFVTDAFALNFYPDVTSGKLSPADLVNLCVSIADDLLLLASVVSRRWIQWDRYMILSNDSLIRYVRTIRPANTERIWREDLLIMPNDCVQFLETALLEYRALKKAGMDLRLPLIYLVSAHERETLESQFVNFFLALEKIKDLYARHHHEEFIIKSSLFRKLSSRTRKVVDELVDNCLKRKEIKEKIPELQRPSMKSMLLRILRYYEVNWEDLYPKGQELTIVNTRHQLFHSSVEVDIDTLMVERYRLQYLLERLVLSMLKWTEHSTAQAPYNREFLYSKP
jgi:hypothetical protein